MVHLREKPNPFGLGLVDYIPSLVLKAMIAASSFFASGTEASPRAVAVLARDFIALSVSPNHLS
jgi:hypothetical protein